MEKEQSSEIADFSKQNKKPKDLLIDTNDFDALVKKGLNFSPLLRTARRNIFLIAGIATVVAGFVGLKAVSSRSNYTSSFQLLVEPLSTEARASEPLSLTRTDRGVPNGDVFGLDYPTQIAVLRSPNLLNDVVTQIQTRYPNFNMGMLQSGLVVMRIGTNMLDSTKIIEVHYEGADPDLVKFVLQKISEKYLKYSLEERKTRIGSGVDFIKKQLPNVQERVDVLQRQLQKVQQEYNLIDPSSQGTQLTSQVSTITNLQLETQRQLQEQRVLYTNLQRQLELSPTEAIAASTLSEDPGYRDLLAKLQEIEGQIAVERARFSEASPVVLSLRQRQSNLKALLNQEAQRILGQNLTSESENPQVLSFQNSVRIDLIGKLVEAANQIQILEVRNQTTSQEKVFFEQRLKQFPAIARQYNDLQRQLDIATRTLDQLIVQRDTLQIEAAQTEIPWELVSTPNEPIPLPSKAKKLLPLGVILGVIVGTGVAVLLEKRKNVFFATEDIQDAIQLPLLGVIPFAERIEQYTYSNGLNALNNSDGVTPSISLFQESFSSLYASIRFLDVEPPIRSLVVCSAAPGDGKTTVALNLAQTVAAMGRRVLLVDANLRAPKLHNELDLPDSQGLGDILIKNLPPYEFIQASPLINNLFILPAGRSTTEALRMLASTRMQEMMDLFQTKFDFVIYDTPHLLGLTDASFLAANTDGFLMVIGVSKTNRSVVMQVLSQLKELRLSGLGIVANHPNRHSKSSYGYHEQQYIKQTRKAQPESSLLHLS